MQPIKLNEKWAITATKHCYQLCVYRDYESGEAWEAKGFFHSISSAVNAWVHHYVRETNTPILKTRESALRTLTDAFPAPFEVLVEDQQYKILFKEVLM